MKYHHDRLGGLSSRLRAELDEVRELELEKRREPSSAPRSHRLAREIHARSARLRGGTRAEESPREELITENLPIDDYERARPAAPEQGTAAGPAHESSSSGTSVADAQR